jgi:hypothetical protein
MVEFVLLAILMQQDANSKNLKKHGVMSQTVEFFKRFYGNLYYPMVKFTNGNLVAVQLRSNF